jgi:hypothetical protein
MRVEVSVSREGQQIGSSGSFCLAVSRENFFFLRKKSPLNLVNEASPLYGNNLLCLKSTDCKL